MEKELKRPCYMGRQIIIEDDIECPNEATHYIVSVLNGLTLEVCTEHANKIREERKKNVQGEDWVVIEEFEILDN